MEGLKPRCFGCGELSYIKEKKRKKEREKESEPQPKEIEKENENVMEKEKEEEEKKGKMGPPKRKSIHVALSEKEVKKLK